jgi:hypothetical protein
MKNSNQESQGNRGVDPQTGHGNDSKGHQNNGNGGGNGGGVISKPGNSHALTK